MSKACWCFRHHRSEFTFSRIKITWKKHLFVPSFPCPAILAKVMQVAVGGGVSLGEQQNLCGDYIFSGHTMIFAVSYLTVRDCEFSQCYRSTVEPNWLSDSPRKLFLLPWASLALSTAGVPRWLYIRLRKTSKHWRWWCCYSEEATTR